MKNSLATVAMIITSASVLSANPFADLPKNHWAYDTLSSFVGKDLRDKVATRYELAALTAELLAKAENQGGNSLVKRDLEQLEKLTVEFADELALLGVKITSLEDDMKVLAQDVAVMKNEVAKYKNNKSSNLKLSGDMFIRNFNQVQKDVLKIHKTESILRLKMEAKIDENVEAVARWRMMHRAKWNGDNKNTAFVDTAYLKIKNLFSFGGELKFGRDWFQHGHFFCLFNFMDAVSYTKRCGDVDLAINIFFDDKLNQGDSSLCHNIYNINADYEYKNHKMYFGVYYTSAKTSKAGNKNDRSVDLELGSHGPLSSINNKLSYDLAATHNKTEALGQVYKGWLGHVALNYDSKKDLTAKVAYTLAGDNAMPDVSRDDENRYVQGSDETIYEDLAVAFSGSGALYNNTKHIKAQLGYRIKNHNKHSFRLAYDKLKEKNSNHISCNLFSYDTLDGKHKINVDLVTFEYCYQLSQHTRLRAAYQWGKYDALKKKEKMNTSFVELFTRF